MQQQLSRIIVVALWVLVAILLIGCNPESNDTIMDSSGTEPGPESTGIKAIEPPLECIETPEQASELFKEKQWPPFCPIDFGNGSFGQWILDKQGNPAYSYTMDQNQNPSARYFTGNGSSTDHWHLIGNARINATAHNGGHIQLYDWTRGPKIINRWNPKEGNFSGGFKLVMINNEYLCTHWDYLPETAAQDRVFGMGFHEKTTHFSQVEIIEHIEAPKGDDPVLYSTTTVTNHSGEPLEITVAEFWDPNIHQLTPAPIMTYGIGKIFEEQRRQTNKKFLMNSFFESNLNLIRIDVSARPDEDIPSPEELSLLDYHPKSIFLAALDPLSPETDSFAVDPDIFFEELTLSKPPPGLFGHANEVLFSNRTVFEGRAILVFRRTINLEPGDSVQWRYLFGYDVQSGIMDLVEKYKNPPAKNQLVQFDFVAPDTPWLSRELAWHAYYLTAGTMYHDFYESRFVDQGSAYGYLQGLSGAPRDFALFTLPMVYLQPELAKEMLTFAMKSQNPQTGAFPYSHEGFGLVSGMGVHEMSSDLDLFFLWALAEYIGATRDMEFLDKKIAYYAPKDNHYGSVFDHAKSAFTHLVEQVRTGKHGLLRCGSGDWNDVLIAFSKHPITTVLHGESGLNAGLAALVLPKFAAIVEDLDPDLSESMIGFAEGQEKALKELWTGRWFARGYLGYDETMLGIDRLFLDMQSFPILANILDNETEQQLFKSIRTECIDPSPVGALSLWPPAEGFLLDPGSDTNGGTWAAIDSWTAWAWANVDPEAAWNFYRSTTLAAHSHIYPNIWYGVWSGPDSYNAYYHDRPGQTFHYTFTPMTDYPVMNMNRHSGPILDAIKLSGINPHGGCIHIDPLVPFENFTIRTSLIGISYTRDLHQGYYVPVVDGRFAFAVRAPVDVTANRAILRVNNMDFDFILDDHGKILFEIAGTAGKKINWEIQ